MHLTLLPGKDVAVPVRFGGEVSPQHSLVLRFGPTELDGTVAGHLVAQAGQDLLAARRVIVWDPVLRSFGWANRYEAERLVERLDPTAALAGVGARGVMGACQAAMTLLDGMLQPGFILIGGIGTILAAYLLYYSLWFLLAKALFLWLFLPGWSWPARARSFAPAQAALEHGIVPGHPARPRPGDLLCAPVAFPTGPCDRAGMRYGHLGWRKVVSLVPESLGYGTRSSLLAQVGAGSGYVSVPSMA